MAISYRWKPIEKLHNNVLDLSDPGLYPLFAIWNEQAEQLKGSSAYRTFMEHMRREIAIETGVIERLYSIDRGITTMLIERGIDEALIPHGATDKPASEVVALIRDQEAAIDSLFDFVADNRTLTTGYIKELHALLTQHQSTVTALEAISGNLIEIPLLRGEWKQYDNNPSREDGTSHEYAPAVHVASEMDRLIHMYGELQEDKVSPEIRAAWLHHAFTQIHPFQDGNGRVARCLASLVFIKDGWFPLTIRNDDRARYIEALEDADRGSLQELIALFAERQKQSFIHALSLSDQALAERRHSAAILSSVRSRLKTQNEATVASRVTGVTAITESLEKLLQARNRQLHGDIKQTLSGIPDTNVTLKRGLPRQGERAQWHTIPIATVATKLRYYANRKTYSAWFLIRIDVASDRTELLYSIHGLGPQDQGLRVISAIAYKRELMEQGQRQVTEIEPLAETPFQYSYIEEIVEVERRFKNWLEETVVAGLSYWQRSL